MEKKGLNKGWNGFLTLCAICGLGVNLLFVRQVYNSIGAEYLDYMRNLALDKETYFYYAERHLSSSRMNRLGFATILLTIVLMLIIIFIKKRAGFFTLWGVAYSAVAVGTVIVDNVPSMKNHYKYACMFAGLAIAAMLFMILGVWIKKIIVMLISLGLAGAAVVAGLKMAIYTSYSIVFADFAGVVAIALLHVIAAKVGYKEPKAKPVPTPAPVAPVPVAICSAESASQAVTPLDAQGADIFAHDQIIVDQKVRAFRIGNAYGLYAEDGTQIGAVAQENIGGGAKAAQLLLGKNMKHLQGFEFAVYDANDRRVAGLRRKGLGFVEFTDAYGNLIGTLKRGKVISPSEAVVAKIKMAGLGKIGILDENGSQAALLQHKWNGLAKAVFTTADKYLVTFTPGLSPEKKAFYLAICIGYDFLAAE
ncbi:MAG: hypothetical protein K5678_01115 [Acetatifactor sp.]|nr:hypothetical protein [Acetatifactor sp.]